MPEETIIGKCTGKNCPIQHDPNKLFMPFECKAVDTCEYATPLTNEQLDYALLNFYLLLAAMTNSISKETNEIAKYLTPPPVPVSMPYSFCGCRDELETDKYQEDCYYYYEEQDMHAHIPCCSKSGKMEPKNCNASCPHYITHRKANEIISSYQSHEEEENV